MAWDEDLLDDQRMAASHTGSHARLLAGPGTGKTLTLARRVAYLVTEQRIPAAHILAMTFTRAAAFELRNRISQVLEGHSEIPRVSTLHSFALRQLLRNSARIDSLPRPIRIADDWEERYIIFEDLKTIMRCNRIEDIKHKFNLLSSDWQTLVADETGWEENFRDPRFLGAWRQHRQVFGYTLRSELVYQLKRALEQIGDFSLESDYSYLLVDEYQDLNRCDLAVIMAIRNMGPEVFAAGDDDQSIYGFRYAHPQGIRQFLTDYSPSAALDLRTCVRCDRRIIDLSSFVASLDPARLPKPLQPRSDAGQGEVTILRFDNEDQEAFAVSSICRYLLHIRGYVPKDILILMRSDRNKAFSSTLRASLEAANVPVSVRAEGSPLDKPEGRVYLSILHLLANQHDSLALRSLLMSRDNRIGGQSLFKLYEIARQRGESFSTSARQVMLQPRLVPFVGSRISNEMEEIQSVLNRHRECFEHLNDSSNPQNLIEALRLLAENIIEDTDNRGELLDFLDSIVRETKSTNEVELLQALSASLEDKEQEIDLESVNIMTMHKAKGLTAKAVIIIAAEDEYIPGRQTGEREDDERRLLYVSLSRARFFLAVTYCDRRIGQQKYTGRTSGSERRYLTRFLQDAPISPMDGMRFVAELHD